MLTCRETTQLISKSLDRQLSWRERFAVRLHLCICKYCKRFSQQLVVMRNALNRMTKSIEDDDSIQLPVETKTRIAHSIESVVD
ncbi:MULTISPECIES: zf-HC2 domain-containing protein [Methylotenera]|uniref:zf-HC2 domain-containing protein n=1 Tax=Methylotenera TaxID=359407 RepID=UPI000372685E|nr:MULTISPECIES: zf-HC2 domain-containing protein [Methylotenera]